MTGKMHWTERLSEYLDGELSPAEMEAAERHLVECAECASLLGELRDVVAEARVLPETPPVRDLWPEIRTRLQSRERPAVPGAGRRVIPLLSRRRVTMTVPQLMAAGLAMAVLSGAAVWAALGSPRTDAAPVAVAAPPAEVPVVLAAFEPGMSTLESEYKARRDELDPETILVIERNLAIIDAAIGEAREALAADPSSGFLNTHLAEAMRRRMTLLREATNI